MENLEKRFNEAMMDIYCRAKAECNYTPSTFHRMLTTNGGIVTAKQLINAAKESEGYTRLYLEGRLDLTVEAVVFETERWHALFTADEVKRCRTRLAKYGYKFTGQS